jgi:hypothetical protein
MDIPEQLAWLARGPS